MTKSLLKSLAVSLALLVLAGCAQIPRSSAIHQGPDVQAGLSSDYLYYSPSGPVLDETKADILAGFLNASTGPQNDYGVAREYLAPSFKTSWSPNDRVYIERGGSKVTIKPNGDAQVTIGVAATVDALGHYSASPKDSSVTLDFTLAKVSGQWRITSAPNAVVMIRPVFDVTFRSYKVYFFDHSFNYLVPDLRWFPARASTATRLAAAILSGPSHWLADAVSPAMPSGTSLEVAAVTTVKSTAVVNLSATALQASKLQKQRFKAQLQATLTQLSGINDVEVKIADGVQNIDDFSPASTSSGAYAPVVLAANQLQQLVGPSNFRLANATAWVKQVGATDFAVTSDQTGVALVGPHGVYTARLDQTKSAPVLSDNRSNLLAPRYDRRGQLWLVGTDGKIQIVAPTGKGQWQSLSWLKDETVKAFAVSPEGARIALALAAKDGTTRIVLASVIRNQLGVVTGFGKPILVPTSVGTPAQIEWSGPTNMVVLSTISRTQSSLSTVTIGGDPTQIGLLDRSVGLMSSDDGANLYVLDLRHRVKQYRGYTWSTLDEDVVAAHMAN
jgi:hypothetical protein